VFSSLPEGTPLAPFETGPQAEGGTNVVLAHAAPEAGLPERAPFDLILLVGAVPALPGSLLEQLGEGGRLVAVVEHGRSGQVVLARKINGAVGRTALFDASIHPLPGLAREPAFSF
jgi:protein-L-isoaspartate(D-aspartate) O-methyltransferase